MFGVRMYSLRVGYGEAALIIFKDVELKVTEEYSESGEGHVINEAMFREFLDESS